MVYQHHKSICPQNVLIRRKFKTRINKGNIFHFNIEVKTQKMCP